ncbi:RNA polymerase sigma-70 factor, ECF subfamily [Sphingobacterium nematocida]|uniref:RNA polymerase sigma-70 factor, ECF subfamily n=1 Tax=Sphingobacterium nematocida TaxID=1513896 RepID=A0A1T5B1U5_9SPHI|nr:RNA polymerase sigma-70 factor [Sphingobacterium nematocida]SKB41202.1 RNA polymerase sigma-70 factor, ECF subfamily [Sphingobacterium nematocida]
MADRNYKVYSDIEIVALLRDNDERAFKEVYERYYPVLHIHAFKKIDNNEAIKDLLQDVFVSFWKNRDQLTISHSLSAYLYAAVRYKISNYILQQQTANKYLDSLQGYIDQQDSIQTDFLVRHKELNQIIEAEINALPPAMRKIFILSRFENLSHKEIASTLSLSDQTVRTQIKNALRILRKKLPLVAYLFLLVR